MQILIPISSESSFFPKEDFYFPKPLIEVLGHSMIEIVISKLKNQVPDPKFIFVIDSHLATTFSLDNTLYLLGGPDTVIVQKDAETAGALCSCLLAIDQVDINSPLLIANSDQIIEDDLNNLISNFVDSNASAGLITFDSIHPRWSYAYIDDDNHVLQCFEKQVVSRNAIAGMYYYKSAKLFFDAAKKVILNDAHFNNIFYLSSSMNQLILDGGYVAYCSIESDSYHSFYSPQKIAEFERLPRAQELVSSKSYDNTLNVVIAAAGQGSRFSKQGWKKPKPFIDIAGKPMIERVVDNITPNDSDVTLLLRSDHLHSSSDLNISSLVKSHNIISVPNLTEGTACTILLARNIIDNNKPLLIANSDQLIDFDVKSFVDDCLSRSLDGSILVFRDPLRDPKWSFAKVNQAELVTQVAEKQPISDLATVGVYLFSKGSDFVESAIDMILSNDRINNEFYTCPVYNYLISKGKNIGIFEVASDSMHGLGTPSDLNLYLEASSLPPSIDSPCL